MLFPTAAQEVNAFDFTIQMKVKKVQMGCSFES